MYKAHRLFIKKAAHQRPLILSQKPFKVMEQHQPLMRELMKMKQLQTSLQTAPLLAMKNFLLL